MFPVLSFLVRLIKLILGANAHLPEDAFADYISNRALFFICNRSNTLDEILVAVGLVKGNKGDAALLNQVGITHHALLAANVGGFSRTM